MEIDWSGIRLGDFESNFMDEEFRRRLRKTLYYGKKPLTERTSLPVTELAVELLQNAAPKELGKIDTQLAASISRKACISPCSLMLGLIYIDRLRQKSPEYLQQVSSADLFLVAMMVASKFLYDDGEDGVYNDEWAESAGMSTESVNELEREFLQAIDWNLLARGHEFEKKLQQLEHSVALRKGKERLWKLSYTDLWVFLRNLECLQLIKANVHECLKIFGAVVSAYVLGVAVLWVSLSMVTTIRSKIYLKDSNLSQAKRSFSAAARAGNDVGIAERLLPDPLKDVDEDVDEDFDDRVGENPFPPAHFQRQVPPVSPTSKRPSCCKKWRSFIMSVENSCRFLRNYETTPVWPFSNCNEDSLCRNMKIKENGFNSTFAQEKVNNSWADFGSTFGNFRLDHPIRVFG